MRVRTATAWFATIALCGAFVAAGCGSSDDEGNGSSASGGQETSTSEGSSAELTKVKAGILPSAPSAPIYLALEKGYFEEEGLDVEPVQMEGSAVIIPAVNSGEVQFGNGSLDGAMLAVANGVPLKLVAPASASHAPESVTSNDVTNTVIVGPDSDIRNAKDLEGKTIAISQLKGLFELGIRASAEREGVDDSTFKFRVLPFAEAVQAAMDGQVDAAAAVEPFIADSLAKGGRAVLNIFPVDPEKYDQWLDAVWYTSPSYYDENRDTVDAFVRAITKANDYANNHEDEVRAIVPTYTQLTPDVVEKIVFPKWATEFEPDQIRDIGALQEKYGFLDKAPTPEELLPDDAGGNG